MGWKCFNMDGKGCVVTSPAHYSLTFPIKPLQYLLLKPSYFSIRIGIAQGTQK
jgi:hypothetical protein